MHMTQISDTCMRITGRSYLGQVSNTNATTANAIGLMFDVNPSLLGDRTAVVAQTYDKYCYQSLKFTYVPQCPTSQPGSVMCVFERDPEAPAANTANTASYMAEVMSYEHAVLTPAWVSTNVTYKRDPHEVKTWYMSGEQANLSPRESSQGTFIAYTSNTSIQTTGANGNLGFVVMDYVLDLVSPNILPSKSIAGSGVAVNQYQPVNNFALKNASTIATPYYQQQFIPGPATNVPAYAGTPGTIFEVVVDGLTITGATGSFNNYLGIYTSGSVVGTTASVGGFLKNGSRFYVTSVLSWDRALVSEGQQLIWYASASLAEAIGLISASAQQTLAASNTLATTTFSSVPAALACTANPWPGGAIIGNTNAWVRVIVNPYANQNNA